MSKAPFTVPDGHWQLVDLIYRNSGLRGNARLVAWSLAQKYYPKKGYSAYPVRKLSEDTGLSTKTILAALKDLEASGEWKSVKKTGAAAQYYPNIQKLQNKQPTFHRAHTQDIEWVERLHANDSPEPKIDETVFDDAVPPLPDTEIDEPLEEVKISDQRVLPDESWTVYDNPGDIARPPVLKSPRSCAARLHKRTPLETRKNKKDFTIESLTRLYTSLSEKYPLQAVDILLWIQCELSQPLNEKFLMVVLSKCTVGNTIIAPTGGTNTGADKTAAKVWLVHQARNWKPGKAPKKRYQEVL